MHLVIVESPAKAKKIAGFLGDGWRVEACLGHVREHGADDLPPTPPTYTAKACNAQEAHEAIRPTDVNRLPKDVDGDGAALYALIWKRFIASQMSAARYAVTGAVIHAGKAQGQAFPLEFRAQGRTLTFDGWLKVYQEPPDDDDEEEASQALPPLSARQQLTAAGLEVITHTTRAPARYSEAALVQALETRGIGRPSTYANTIKTLKDKGYVTLKHKRLVPTENGVTLCDFLTAHFADVLAEDYTARLESQLDRITAGETRALDVLRAFWTDFQPQLQLAAAASTPTRKPLTLRPLEVSDDARP
jgi:DNA topoisomerase-1